MGSGPWRMMAAYHPQICSSSGLRISLIYVQDERGPSSSNNLPWNLSTMLPIPKLWQIQIMLKREAKQPLAHGAELLHSLTPIWPNCRTTVPPFCSLADWLNGRTAIRL